MKADYSDILAAAKVEPLWYDEVGCPRFVDFHPGLCSSAYAMHAKLLQIRCQECSKEFRVCISTEEEVAFVEIRFDENLYGDPPRHLDHNGETCAGITMNSETIAVLDIWDYKG